MIACQQKALLVFSTCALVWLAGCGSEPVAPQVSPTPIASGRSAPREEGEDLKVRKRIKHRAGGILDLTFDDLEFDIERDADFERRMLSEEIESMVGKTIIIRGYMLDAGLFQTKGIKQFVFVRDNQECCFGPGAYIYHNAQIEMVKGESVNYTPRAVIVKGKLDIRPFLGPRGKCYSVYHITAESVKER
jgi:hypothetical protein